MCDRSEAFAAIRLLVENDILEREDSRYVISLGWVDAPQHSIEKVEEPLHLPPLQSYHDRNGRIIRYSGRRRPHEAAWDAKVSAKRDRVKLLGD